MTNPWQPCRQALRCAQGAAALALIGGFGLAALRRLHVPSDVLIMVGIALGLPLVVLVLTADMRAREFLCPGCGNHFPVLGQGACWHCGLPKYVLPDANAAYQVPSTAQRYARSWSDLRVRRVLPFASAGLFFTAIWIPVRQGEKLLVIVGCMVIHALTSTWLMMFRCPRCDKEFFRETLEMRMKRSWFTPYYGSLRFNCISCGIWVGDEP